MNESMAVIERSRVDRLRDGRYVVIKEFQRMTSAMQRGGRIAMYCRVVGNNVVVFQI